MGRGQGTVQGYAQDRFSDVFGTKRGTDRGDEASAAPTGVSATLIDQHLRSCGWGTQAGRLTNEGKLWYVKSGHARISTDGEVLGQIHSAMEAMEAQIREEYLLEHGWAFVGGKWRHPHACQHEHDYVREADLCQYSYERRSAKD